MPDDFLCVYDYLLRNKVSPGSSFIGQPAVLSSLVTNMRGTARHDASIEGLSCPSGKSFHDRSHASEKREHTAARPRPPAHRFRLELQPFVNDKLGRKEIGATLGVTVRPAGGGPGPVPLW